MTHHDPHTDHAHEPVDSGGLTSFAIVKYGFILIITIVVLYFVARYLIPLFTNG